MMSFDCSNSAQSRYNDNHNTFEGIAMLQREAIEAVMMEIAHLHGLSLNGRDRLVIKQV